jgi:hypothetical protein
MATPVSTRGTHWRCTTRDSWTVPRLSGAPGGQSLQHNHTDTNCDQKQISPTQSNQRSNVK